MDLFTTLFVLIISIEAKQGHVELSLPWWVVILVRLIELHPQASQYIGLASYKRLQAIIDEVQAITDECKLELELQTMVELQVEECCL
jgi:hypothetical protein